MISFNFWLNYPFKHSMTNWKLVCLQKVMTSLDHLKSSSKSATMSQNTATNLSWIVQQGLAICCVGTKPSRAHIHIHTHPGGDQCVLRESPLPVALYPSGLAAFLSDVYTLVTQSPRERAWPQSAHLILWDKQKTHCFIHKPHTYTPHKFFIIDDTARNTANLPCNETVCQIHLALSKLEQYHTYSSLPASTPANMAPI